MNFALLFFITLFTGILATDTTPPVITLNGAETMYHEAGSIYYDPGATAVDIVDGTLTVAVVSDVNTAKVGTYTVTYSVSDDAGNVAIQVVRTVTVFSQPSSAEIKTRYNAGDCNGYITLCGTGTIWKNVSSSVKHCEIDTNIPCTEFPKRLSVTDAYNAAFDTEMSAAYAEYIAMISASGEPYEFADFFVTAAAEAAAAAAEAANAAAYAAAYATYKYIGDTEA